MIKIKRLIILICLTLILVSCSDKKEDKIDESFSQKDPKPIASAIDIKSTSFVSSILLDSMKNNDNFSYNPTNVDDLEEIMNGNFDIAIVPAILAPSIYNTTNASVSIAAISLVNNLYALSDTQINSPKDMFGKKLLIRDMGSVYKKALDSKLSIIKGVFGIDVLFYKNIKELEDYITANDSYIAVVSEPYLSKIKNNKKSTVYNLTEIMPYLSDEKLSVDSDIVSEVVLVNNKFLKDKKSTFDRFLDDLKVTTEKLKDNPEISANIINRYDLSSDDAMNIYKNMDVVYIDGDTMKGLYNIYLDGIDKLKLDIYHGDRPSDDFYYYK